MESREESANSIRYILKIYGIVQGVGFRPHVYKKAVKFQIEGYVENMGGAVLIDCSGTRTNIRAFLLEVIKKPPTLAKIEKVLCEVAKDHMPFKGDSKKKFTIKESLNEKSGIKFVSPDVAVCSKCLEDIRIRGTSRYRYAFTNCTECGPRYSIIKVLPYDRPYTTMESFKMCENCGQEYVNPLSRRFHAQPNCCEKCGPKLYLSDSKGSEIQSEDPLEQTIKLLEKGKILAVKGIGGFHLVCDGRNSQAINILRSRKLRKDKPLALMAKDMSVVKEICYVSEKEEEILESNKRPIVLLKKKEPFSIPEEAAPKQNRLGILLPYTPLHHLLFEGSLNLLVMTSGNISGMPIEYKNREALVRLSKVADYFLMHNRDIHIPVDDSVVKVVEDEESVVRRARGYTPSVFKIETSKQIIALGGEQKNTICVSKNGYTHSSQYLGDLGEANCYENFKHALGHFTKLFDISTDLLVYDMHPSYSSTRYANEQNIKKLAVQHHHAHMVSCMAEHHIYDSVIGVIFDGTGYGLDKAVWGGEFFIGNRSSFKRAGHLQYVQIQGGEQAVREPWRCAASYMNSLGCDPVEIIEGVEKEKIYVVMEALASGLNCFKSSSVGRLFDAVAALVGIRNYITYDGQAAIELENVINEETDESYLWSIVEVNKVFLIQYKGILKGIIKDLMRKEAVSKISVKFHNSLAEAACALVSKLREKEGINKVVLSGGVFENQYLLKKIHKELDRRGFQVFYNKKIPINDGGISFGQLYAASVIMKEGGS